MKGDATASDYWSHWVLLLSLLRRFRVKGVVKALPMMWKLLDVAERVSLERRACVEGIFLGFLAAIANTFTMPALKASVSKVSKFTRKY
jgi:hypothetical protein